jgi:hypothetical protein
MSPFILTLLLHTLAAVLGIGQISAIAVVGSALAGKGGAAPAVIPALERLVRGATWSSLVMLVTGIALDLEVDRAFDRTWWFRGSVLLLVVLGYLLMRAKRALRGGDAAAVAGAGRLARGMAAIVVLLVGLMILKPG